MENSEKIFEQALSETNSESIHYKEMSEQEREAVMKTMSDNFEHQEEPKVGIFWYDGKTDSLFGVTKSFAEELQYNLNGLKTVRILHKQWWQREKNKCLSKGAGIGIFNADYTQIPRGRIFQYKDGNFQLMCGSWINEHIIDLVKEEFDLKNVPLEVKIDEHWEIGHGWSEEYGL
jgi:hypothetical protein